MSQKSCKAIVFILVIYYSKHVQNSSLFTFKLIYQLSRVIRYVHALLTPPTGSLHCNESSHLTKGDLMHEPLYLINYGHSDFGLGLTGSKGQSYINRFSSRQYWPWNYFDLCHFLIRTCKGL